MAIVKAVSKITVANTILKELAEGAKEKLLKFCTARVIELGLATKLYKNTFPIDGNYLESVKSLGRLRTLLLKQLQKTIPYVNMASDEYFKIYDRDKFCLSVTTPWQKGGLDKSTYFPATRLGDPNFKVPSNYQIYRNQNLRNDYLMSSKINRILVRYVRYLNYIFRKYRIPLQVNMHQLMEWNEGEVNQAANGKFGELNSVLLRNRLMFNLIFTVSAWKASSAIAFEEAQKSKEARDRFFATPSNWVSYAIIGNDPATTHGTVDYSPAKLFLHMDKAGKLISTLTRKTAYDSSAYSFGDS